MELESKLWDFNSFESISRDNEIIERQNQLGQACPLFAHSLGEGAKPVFLHAQVTANYLTIEEIITKFCDYFG